MANATDEILEYLRDPRNWEKAGGAAPRPTPSPPDESDQILEWMKDPQNWVDVEALPAEPKVAVPTSPSPPPIAEVPPASEVAATPPGRPITGPLAPIPGALPIPRLPVVGRPAIVAPPVVAPAAPAPPETIGPPPLGAPGVAGTLLRAEKRFEPVEGGLTIYETRPPLAPTPEEEKRSFAAELYRNMLAGTAGLGAAVGTGLEMFGAEKTGAEIQRFWKTYERRYETRFDESVLDNPSLLINPRWLGINVARFAPSVAASLVGGGAVGGAIRVGSRIVPWSPQVAAKLAALGARAVPWGAGATGGALEATGLYEELTSQGAEPGQARAIAGFYGLISAGLNAASFDVLFNNPAGRRWLTRAFVAGGVESVTEALEEPAQELTVAFGGDPTLLRNPRAVIEAMLAVSTPAFVLGGLAGAIKDGGPAARRISDRLLGVAQKPSLTQEEASRAVDEAFAEALAAGAEAGALREELERGAVPAEPARPSVPLAPEAPPAAQPRPAAAAAVAPPVAVPPRPAPAEARRPAPLERPRSLTFQEFAAAQGRPGINAAEPGFIELRRAYDNLQAPTFAVKPRARMGAGGLDVTGYQVVRIEDGSPVGVPYLSGAAAQLRANRVNAEAVDERIRAIREPIPTIRLERRPEPEVVAPPAAGGDAEVGERPGRERPARLGPEGGPRPGEAVPVGLPLAPEGVGAAPAPGERPRAPGEPGAPGVRGPAAAAPERGGEPGAAPARGALAAPIEVARGQIGIAAQEPLPFTGPDLERAPRRLYHGTAGPAFSGFSPGVVYLTADPQEASVFASDPILNQGGANPRIIEIGASRGRVKDIDAVVQQAVMDAADLDAVISAEASTARDAGYRYLTFRHPPGFGDEDFAAVVSLFPESDLSIRRVAGGPVQRPPAAREAPAAPEGGAPILAPREVGAPRRRGAGVRLIGLGISPEARAARADFVEYRGQRVRNARDVARLLQPTRDPRWETFRVVYVDDTGNVLAVEAVSSRHVRTTIPFIDTRGWNVEAIGRALDADDVRAVPPSVWKMRQRMRRLGATGYWLSHNHPTGRPAPSASDESLNDTFNALVPGLRGHVVIDSGSYGVIEIGATGPVSEVRLLPTDDRILEPSIPHPILGRLISNPEDLALAIQDIVRPEGYLSMLYLGSDGRVRAIEEIPVNLFLAPRSGRDWPMADYIRGAKRDYGASQVIAYAGGATRDIVRGAGERLVDSNLLTAFQYPGRFGIEGPAARVREAEPGPAFRVQEPEGGEFRAEPGPVFYSQVERVARSPRVPERGFAPQILAAIENAPGVKPDEIKWLGLREWLREQGGRKIGKQEVLGFIRANEVRVEEIVRGAPSGPPAVEAARGREARYDRPLLNLPGGENYREALLTWAPRGAAFRGGHFDEPNVLAHIRFDERTDVEGKRVLFIQEVQSDWAQAGRREGFAERDRAEILGLLAEAGYQADYNGVNWVVTSKDGSGVPNRLAGGTDKNQFAGDLGQVAGMVLGRRDLFPEAGRIPSAPFVTTGTWHELVTKRMLRWAAENGFDRLAWTTGQQQADRYDLSKRIDRLSWVHHDDDRTYSLFGSRRDREVFSRTIPEHELDHWVGLDLGNRIRAGEGGVSEITAGTRPFREISGLDLRVGGESLRALYDQMIPQFVNKFAKQWGARAGEVQLPAGKRWSVRRTDTDEVLGVWDTRAEAARDQDSFEREGIPTRLVESTGEAAAPGGFRAHSIDITPSMRGEIVSRGIALFEPAEEFRPRRLTERDIGLLAREPEGGYTSGESGRRLDLWARLVDYAAWARGQEGGDRQAWEARMRRDLGDAAAPHLNALWAEISREEEATPSPETPPEAPTADPLSEDPSRAVNINLDRLITVEAVKDEIRQVGLLYREQIQAHRRRTITFDQVRRLAQETGVDAAKLNAVRAGEAWAAEDLLAARRMLVASAQDLHGLHAAAAAGGSDEDMARFAVALQRHVAIQKAVSGLTAEAGRALAQFRIGASATAEAYRRMVDTLGGREVTQEIAERLGRMDPGRVLQLNQFVRHAVQPRFKDKIFEVWINALLSGPRTHVVNVTSNFLFNLERGLVERTAAGAIDWARAAATGTRQERFIGEGRAEAYGLMRGLAEGAHAFAESWRTEMPVFGREREPFLAHPPAVGGRIGAVVRTPTRLLRAEDEFSKAVGYRMALQALAYRRAASEGLVGQAFARRLTDLAQEPDEAIIAEAQQEAKVRTFTDEGSKFAKAIIRLRDTPVFGFRPLKYIIPFVSTPERIFVRGIERTPLGWVLIAVKQARGIAEERAAAREGREPEFGRLRGGEVSDEIAKAAVGTLLSAGMAAMVWASMGTGGGPGDPADKQPLYATGWQPYAFRLADIFFAYGRLEPFGLVFGTVADFIEGLDERQKVQNDEAATRVVNAVIENFQNKSFLTGLRDASRAWIDPERYGQWWLQGLASTVVPQIAAQTVPLFDPTARRGRTTGQAILARIPGLSRLVPPVRDIWGQPVTRTGLERASRFISPVTISEAKDDPAALELVRLGVRLGRPGRDFEGVRLTDEEHGRYSEVLGRVRKEKVSEVVQRESYAKAVDDQWRMDRIADALRDAGTIAGDRFRREIPFGERRRRKEERKMQRLQPPVRRRIEEQRERRRQPVGAE